MRKLALVLVALLILPTAFAADTDWKPVTPNVVYVLCDDLGYGDVHALNPERGKIATPNIDRFISRGMSFTDSHSSSAVCTPSRYSILTGRYNWRSRLQKGVLNGESEPLISNEHLTVAQLLKQQGYATAAMGKWHLGLQFESGALKGKITDGPLQHGFDQFFGISASLDMPPFAWIQDDDFTEALTATKKWVRTGPAAPGFEAVDVVPSLVEHASAYVTSHADGAKSGKPFFLYLALPSPHTPLVPSPQWQGKSDLGPYGDYVMETDWAFGQVLASIESSGLQDNTLVIFTSDNGCAPYIGVKDLEAKGHFPSAQFRGYKADIWEGGHRIPFAVRWPGVVKPGSTSSQMIGLIDLIATCAQITGVTLPDNAGEDSVSILPALRGIDTVPLREAEVFHSINGNFAIQKGKWKLELCAGSGGWGAPREPQAAAEHLPDTQLYDLETDIAEQHNVQADHPDVVKELTDLLKRYVEEGRSTPGPKLQNDARIQLRKKVQPSTNLSAPVDN